MKKYVGKHMNMKVKAFKILDIETRGGVVTLIGDGIRHIVSETWCNIARPQIGGYYVKLKKRHGGGGMCLDADTFHSVYVEEDDVYAFVDGGKAVESDVIGIRAAQHQARKDTAPVLFVDANGYEVREGEEVYVATSEGRVTPMRSDEYMVHSDTHDVLMGLGFLKGVYKKRDKAEEAAKEARYWMTKLIDDYNNRIMEQKEEKATEGKSLHNTTANGAKKNVKDIQFWGNGDTFRLISKASSEKEGWMKSTKAMPIDGIGVVVQVTTQQRNPDGSYAVAEALTFVPGAVILDNAVEAKNEQGYEVVGRELIAKPLTPSESDIINQFGEDANGPIDKAEELRNAAMPLVQYLKNRWDADHSVIVSVYGAHVISDSLFERRADIKETMSGRGTIKLDSMIVGD